VAVAVVEGPQAGLELLEGLELDSHRVDAVRAHLLEEAGDTTAAAAAYTTAAGRTTNARERDYLTMRAARARAESRS
jgi:predicted RNA polymerase sigma factor